MIQSKMQMKYDTTTRSGKEQAIADYSQEVSTCPDLSFKAFCDKNGINNYKKLLWWCNGQGISINALRMKKKDKTQPRQGEGAFIQFTPAQRPSSCNLRGVNITFPDGVNLTLQESSAESVISLLSIYQSRCQGGVRPCSD